MKTLWQICLEFSPSRLVAVGGIRCYLQAHSHVFFLLLLFLLCLPLQSFNSSLQQRLSAIADKKGDVDWLL